MRELEQTCAGFRKSWRPPVKTARRQPESVSSWRFQSNQSTNRRGATKSYWWFRPVSSVHQKSWSYMSRSCQQTVKLLCMEKLAQATRSRLAADATSEPATCIPFVIPNQARSPGGAKQPALSGAQQVERDPSTCDNPSPWLVERRCTAASSICFSGGRAGL